MVDIERRKALRQRTLKSGSIAFNGASRINCLIRNQSSIGACLEVTSPIGIPDSFVLVVDSSNARIPCHVVWRNASRVGVAFAHGPAVDDASAASGEKA